MYASKIKWNCKYLEHVSPLHHVCHTQIPLVLLQIAGVEENCPGVSWQWWKVNTLRQTMAPLCTFYGEQTETKPQLFLCQRWDFNLMYVHGLGLHVIHRLPGQQIDRKAIYVKENQCLCFFKTHIQGIPRVFLHFARCAGDLNTLPFRWPFACFKRISCNRKALGEWMHKM